MRKVEDTSLAHDACGPDDIVRANLVQRPGLVVCAVFAREPVHRCHSDDHVSRKSAYSVSPPSTKIVWPVMYAASSDNKNAVTAAISSASPARPIGMCDVTISRFT